MDANQLNELEQALKNPESQPETSQEMADRLQCYQLFINSHLGLNCRTNRYEAGWKAAKAYYEARQ